LIFQKNFIFFKSDPPQAKITKAAFHGRILKQSQTLNLFKNIYKEESKLRILNFSKI